MAGVGIHDFRNTRGVRNLAASQENGDPVVHQQLVGLKATYRSYQSITVNTASGFTAAIAAWGSVVEVDCTLGDCTLSFPDVTAAIAAELPQIKLIKTDTSSNRILPVVAAGSNDVLSWGSSQDRVVRIRRSPIDFMAIGDNRIIVVGNVGKSADLVFTSNTSEEWKTKNCHIRCSTVAGAITSSAIGQPNPDDIGVTIIIEHYEGTNQLTLTNGGTGVILNPLGFPLTSTTPGVHWFFKGVAVNTWSLVDCTLPPSGGGASAIAGLQALRSQSTPTDPTKIYSLAYRVTVGDVRMPSYRWDSTATLADNGGTIIKPDTILAANPGRYVAIVNDAVNVKWFGAIGNDTGDDGIPINAALNSGYRHFYIPDGTYRIVTFIQIPFANGLIEGAGEYRTILKATSAMASVHMIEALSGYGITFKDFGLHGGDLGTKTGFRVTGYLFKFDNISVNNRFLIGWHCFGVWDSVWDGITSQNDTVNAARSGTGIEAHYSVNNFITNSKLGNWDLCLNLGVATHPTLNYMNEGWMLVNSSLIDSKKAILGDRITHLAVDNCMLDLLLEYGVYCINGFSASITNCWFGGVANNFIAVAGQNTFSDFKVSVCEIQNGGSFAGQQAFVMNSPHAKLVDNTINMPGGQSFSSSISDFNNSWKVSSMTHSGTRLGISASEIGNYQVNNAKLTQMPPNSLKGNNTGVFGDAQDLTMAQVQTMLAVLTEKSRRITVDNDFLIGNTTALGFFSGAAVGTGTLSVSPGTLNNPGQVRLRSSTSANNGYRISSDPGAIILKGGEKCLFHVNFFTTAGIQNRLGFLNVANAAIAVDGAHFEVNAGVLSIRTISNGVTTLGGTTLTVTQGTWYTLYIEVNSAGTSINFRVFNYADGVQLYNQNLTTNLPIGTNKTTGFQVLSTTSATAITDLLLLDYMGLELYPSRPTLQFA